ncbi:ATP-binding protein [Methyloligella sp. 2.7D]|uniref:sensor histidine kinase n=1 Tax=unclassified Methyloligella TaxID=2625955 RepID=UPI00157E100B|nr:PAS domain-containing sensor histidine kinase [Methyloligella sp. GL2]QKP76054.1 PAS-domain containing protein [Methyloligella sp. GL2]
MAEPAATVDARILFTLGISLGVIAFATGMAVYSLRAVRRAREATDEAAAEVQALRKRKDRLESVLAAEPQILFAWTDSPRPRLLVANLPPSLGVPSAPTAFLDFPAWLDADGIAGLERALGGLMENGEAFNLMLRTLTDRYIEIDGRAAGAALTVRVRDLAGQRLEAARQERRRQAMESQFGVLKRLLNTLPEPVWLKGADRRIAWVNKAYAEAADAGLEETVIADQIDLLNQTDRADAEASLARGQAFQREVECLTETGPQRFLATMTGDGMTAAGIASKTAGGAAAPKGDFQTKLRSFDRMSTAFAVFDSGRHLVHFNQAYADLWQLDPAWLASGPSDGEILDRLRLSRLLPEKANYQEWKERWLSSYGKDVQFDETWHLPDGRMLHVVTDATPGDGVTYLFENVTEKISLESRYNALIQVQRETLDTLREGVAVFSADGALRLYNRAFASIWQLQPHQLDGEPHIDEVIGWCRALYDNAEEWERTKTAVTAITSDRHPYESHLDRPDGSVIACAALPLPDGGTLLTYVDVSDTVRAERALIEKNEALEAADRLKTAFISHVSYELRTPLTNIIGFTDLLSNPATGELAPKQKEYLNDIEASGRTLLAIIDDILDLASIDAGDFQLERSAVDVHRVVENLKTGLRDRLKQSGVRLDVRIEPSVSELAADEQRLAQILYNLLSNAIGFSPEGGEVKLTCEAQGDMVGFRVEDQGAGIPEEYQRAVFDRFESRTDGSRHRGAGLGLSIVKNLVELHGGSIVLSSEFGKGTSVEVWLPRAEPSDKGRLARPAE